MMLEAVEVDALDPEVWWDLGPKMTCTEAEAIVALLEAVGCVRAADALRRGHVEGEEEEDAHYGGWDRPWPPPDPDQIRVYFDRHYAEMYDFGYAVFHPVEHPDRPRRYAFEETALLRASYEIWRYG